MGWYSKSNKRACKRLQRVVETARSITRTSLPIIQSISMRYASQRSPPSGPCCLLTVNNRQEVQKHWNISLNYHYLVQELPLSYNHQFLEQTNPISAREPSPDLPWTCLFAAAVRKIFIALYLIVLAHVTINSIWLIFNFFQFLKCASLNSSINVHNLNIYRYWVCRKFHSSLLFYLIN